MFSTEKVDDDPKNLSLNVFGKKQTLREFSWRKIISYLTLWLKKLLLAALQTNSAQWNPGTPLSFPALIHIQEQDVFRTVPRLVGFISRKVMRKRWVKAVLCQKPYRGQSKAIERQPKGETKELFIGSFRLQNVLRNNVGDIFYSCNIYKMCFWITTTFLSNQVKATFAASALYRKFC